MRLSFRMLLAMFAALALVAAACGSEDSDDAASADEAAEAEGGAAADDGSADDAGSDDGSEDGADTERPTVVVTTTILGDVVENLVGDEVEVVTIMPTGADPHDFQASAAQVAQMNEADVLIVNGGGIEEGLLDVIEAAEEDGVVVFEFLSAVETIEYGEGGHDHDHGDEEHGDDHGDEEHGDEEHGDDHGDEEHGDDHGDEEHGDEEHGDEEHGDEEHGDDEHGDEEHGDDEHGDDEHGDDEHGDDHDHAHDHDGADPHFWTDPARMAIAADAAAEFLMANLEGIDADAVTASAEAYVAELEALDAEVEATLSPIPEENRVFVTNHDSFGYFADRFDFEVAGTVIPSGSTLDGTSAQDLAELAEVVEDEGVPAIFTETTVSDDLAQTLADEVGGDVAIVEIYTGSLGEAGSEGDTYIGMQRTNAERIAGALS